MLRLLSVKKISCTKFFKSTFLDAKDPAAASLCAMAKLHATDNCSEVANGYVLKKLSISTNEGGFIRDQRDGNLIKNRLV